MDLLELLVVFNLDVEFGLRLLEMGIEVFEVSHWMSEGEVGFLGKRSVFSIQV